MIRRAGRLGLGCGQGLGASRGVAVHAVHADQAAGGVCMADSRILTCKQAVLQVGWQAVLRAGRRTFRAVSLSSMSAALMRERHSWGGQKRLCAATLRGRGGGGRVWLEGARAVGWAGRRQTLWRPDVAAQDRHCSKALNTNATHTLPTLPLHLFLTRTRGRRSRESPPGWGRRCFP
jgi:hypothetical protein